MNVNELLELSYWVEENISRKLRRYEKLADAIESNSVNTSKVSIEVPLSALTEALRGMSIRQLSAEQIDLLERHGIGKYIGNEGEETFNEIVRVADYDLGTAAATAQIAYQRLENATRAFDGIAGALKLARVDLDSPSPPSSTDVVTKVHFKDRAMIANVVDLEKWTKDWLTIAQGLASAADERPEDVRVIGASTGSVVLWLATSLTIATILALMVKRVNSIILDIVNGLNALEQLRHTRVMNTQVEDVMKLSIRNIRDNATVDVTQHIKEHLSLDIAAANEALLNRAIEKFLDFSEKGGRVDMIAPPQQEGDTGVAPNSDIESLQTLIADVRKLQDSIPRQLPGPEMHN